MGRPADRRLTPATPPAEAPPRSAWFWAGLVAGWAVMAYGIAGALAEARDTRPAALARWVIGSALAHDGLIAPVAIVVGVAVARFVPRNWRAAVQGGLITSGVVLLFSLPLVGGYGVRPDNPSVLYRDYGPAVAAVLAATWVATAVVGACNGRRRRGD